MYNKQIKGLHLAIPKLDSELFEIAEAYAESNPEGMVPVNIQQSVVNFRNHLKAGSYIRLIKYDDEIFGFIGATQINPLHTSEKTVQQLYYYCELEGLAAFRAVVLAHEGLINYAEGIKAKYVISPCSQFYKNDNLCRILKTQGWGTFGYLAVWKTSHNSAPSTKVSGTSHNE